jgi:hypothetical protein
MLPLSSVTRKHSIDFHCYTGDTQLYISVSSEDFSSTDKLLDCISDLNMWMAHNFLQLNQDKTEVLIVGAKVQRDNHARTFEVIKIKHQVKNLGVSLDSELNFESYIRNMTEITFYYLEDHCQCAAISLPG